MLLTMPAKHRLINYQSHAHYHIYNRGNNKAEIFPEQKDYWVFRKFAKSTIDDVPGITILNFALLPNHFHLLIFQENDRDIVAFMRRLLTKYALYFRKKYSFQGHVFGGSYRAALLKQSPDVVAVKKYIMNNPVEAGLISWKHVGANI